MDAESDFEGLVAKIKAELTSLGRLISGAKVGPGVSLITCPDLPVGWLGITDTEGRKAFGPAS